MTPFYNKKSFPWLIALSLVGINMGLLVFLWAGKDGRPPAPHHPIQVEDILGFDDAQRSQFKALQTSHFETKDGIRMGLGMHRDSAFAQLRGGQPKMEEVERHFAAMGAITQKIELEIFDHFMKVRAMCKPAQLPKFDTDLIEEITRRPKPGRGGPPPRH